MHIKKRYLHAFTLAVCVMLLGLIAVYYGNKPQTLSAYMKTLADMDKQEIVVAVIDTGLDMSDDGINEKRIKEGYNISESNMDVTDEIGHGTTIAKLILENTSDLVSILPIKVADKKGEAEVDKVAEALRYALEQGVDVINLSMNTSFYADDVALMM